MAIERDLRQSGRTASVDVTEAATSRLVQYVASPDPSCFKEKSPPTVPSEERSQKSSRGNKTSLELFLAGLSDWDQPVLLRLFDATLSRIRPYGGFIVVP